MIRFRWDNDAADRYYVKDLKNSVASLPESAISNIDAAWEVKLPQPTKPHASECPLRDARVGGHLKTAYNLGQRWCS
jgi:hypothetical protein